MISAAARKRRIAASPLLRLPLGRLLLASTIAAWVFVVNNALAGSSVAPPCLGLLKRSAVRIPDARESQGLHLPKESSSSHSMPYGRCFVLFSYGTLQDFRGASR